MATRERDKVQELEFDYGSKAGVRKALRALLQLQGKLRTNGDQMAAAIMVDLKTCLGGFKVDKAMNVLTDRQRGCIVRCLVNGDTELEAAVDIGIKQSSVNRAINAGLSRIIRFLGGEQPASAEWRAWEETVLIELYYDKGQKGGAKGVASRLGRTTDKVYAKARELRKKGLLTRRGR